MSTADKLKEAYVAKADAQAQLVAAQHSRMITRSAVKESIRTDYANQGAKITESRLDDLAHVHKDYIEACTDESQATKKAVEMEGAVRAAEAEHEIELVKMKS